MASNPTRLEAGHNHLLAYCRTCPSWRRLAMDRPEALEEAARHVQLVHGMAELASDMRLRARQLRHANG